MRERRRLAVLIFPVWLALVAILGGAVAPVERLERALELAAPGAIEALALRAAMPATRGDRARRELDAAIGAMMSPMTHDSNVELVAMPVGPRAAKGW